ncbi:MAG: hypothetical protein WAV11_01595 [Minisyncoccia bacterium]
MDSDKNTNNVNPVVAPTNNNLPPIQPTETQPAVIIPVIQPIVKQETTKPELPVVEETPASLLSQVKPTDDPNETHEKTLEEIENHKNHPNIQAAWSHYHPEKEQLVEENKGTGIYSYVEKPELDKNNYLKTAAEAAAAHPVRQIVRTFQKDVEEAVRYNHVSSIDIALAEQKHRDEQNRAAEMAPSTGEDVKRFRLFVYIFIGLILIGGGISLIYFFIIPAITKTTVPDAITQTAGYNLLRTEEKISIDLDKIDVTKLAVVLRNAIDTSSILPNNIQEIVFSKTDSLGKLTNIDSASFLSLVGINPPAEINRDLQKPFVYGLHNLGGNQPFLVLYTGAYSSGFNGMWAWQSSGMIKDFKKIFNIYDAPVINEAGREVQSELFFQDTIIRSLNAWIVKNSLGKIILAYTIFDNNTVIISTNTETIKTIVDRMIAEKTQTR